jgi:hypothetical protein
MSDTAPDQLTPEESAAIAEAEAELARGERVPPDAVESFWSTHGLACLDISK